MIPTICPLVGVTNGYNVVFDTPSQYASGSVRVFRNGVALQPTLADGFVEAGGTKLLMKQAPKSTDVMSAYYIPL